jgi:hypothetical protein
MKKIFAAMSLAILCTCFQVLAEEQSTQSENSTEMVNLIDLAQQKNLDTIAGLNITQAASGKNASVNLVMGPPGSILKMHYHRYHDEITFMFRVRKYLINNVSISAMRSCYGQHRGYSRTGALGDCHQGCK